MAKDGVATAFKKVVLIFYTLPHGEFTGRMASIGNRDLYFIACEAHSVTNNIVAFMDFIEQRFDFSTLHAQDVEDFKADVLYGIVE